MVKTNLEGNILDYLDWRGDITFSQDPVNMVDGLIFSTLAYLNLPVSDGAGLPLHEIKKEWSKLPEGDQYRGIDIMEKSCRMLAESIADYPRYRDLTVTDYVELSSEEQQMQFSAATFLLPENNLFVAYRGTDNTIVGWKEDFNMAFIAGTPAQLEATRYLKMIAEKYPDCSIYIGGHSKGGNLAVWAAGYLPDDINNRIIRVFNNDGPGFIEDFTDSPQFKAVKDKIFSYVPESSIIGVLMGGCEYRIIKSSSVSLLQHDPFSWKVLGNSFIYDSSRSLLSRRISRKCNEIIRTMNKEEYAEFIEKIYDDIRASDADTLDDLQGYLLKKVLSLPGRIKDLK
ncbi:MAG: DUF2974 domain-containing protein [Clostridia bacterium]|nr:DUF2974 domain-containing protein [Clostridia bacterium]